VDKSTVLITGASSGIGYELARAFAAHGHDLIITARREDRLSELAASLPTGCRVQVIPVDLAKAKGPAKLVAAIQESGWPVDVLVNNAGTASTGPFQDLNAAPMRDMLQLNVRALTELTYALLPSMLERRRGRILNVASVASFQGVPGMALYRASKAFVLALTEGLSEDLRGTGVTVTALCPGLTRTDMVKDFGNLGFAESFLASAQDVAREGYRACMAGEVVRVPGVMNQTLVTWMQYQPRWLVRLFSGAVSRAAR
jgi:short-subunit dehydrogenase